MVAFLDVVQRNPNPQIFTHIADDGVTRHFAIDLLQDYAVKNLLVEKVDLDHAFAQYICKERGIETDHLARINAHTAKQPVIYLRWYDGSHLLVDGHHRYVWRSRHGIDFIRCRIFDDIPTWEQFLITGLPDFLETRLTGSIRT